jgi:hypothetical protein
MGTCGGRSDSGDPDRSERDSEVGLLAKPDLLQLPCHDVRVLKKAYVLPRTREIANAATPVLAAATAAPVITHSDFESRTTRTVTSLSPR